MSWVRLEDLLADDKNFYGLIPMDVPCVAMPGDHFSFVKPQYRARIVEALPQVHSPKELIALLPEFNSPEWSLSEDGMLHNWDGPYKKDGELFTATFLKLDIRDWLATQPKRVLRTIATLAFWAWSNHHPEWPEITDSDLPGLPTSVRHDAIGGTVHDPVREAAFYRSIGVTP